MKQIFLLWLTIFLVAGCAGHQEKDDSQEAPFILPASFAGSVGCEGCPATEVTLTLRPDGLFLLRTVKDSNTVSTLGTYEFLKRGKIIVIGSPGKGLGSFAVAPPSLRQLSEQGEVLPGEGHELVLLDKPAVFNESFRMRGMFSRRKGEALLRECSSGKVFPLLAQGGAYRRMEDAFLKTPHGKDDALLMSFSGSLEEQADFEQPAVEFIRITDFTRAYPDMECDGEQTHRRLIGTTWKLLELQGEPVKKIEGRQTPFFTLDEKEKRMRGFGGCNRFFGTYLVYGDVFVFNKIAGTRMACSKGEVLEDRFLKALDRTESFIIDKDVLQLLDSKGEVIARLLGVW
ncbi:MAG: hypothetical protein CSA34_05630 [Desulfobulbus propionicus]|nr:MAG: hypothetical protein CSA34_05630 [Desulfobulbus propionicus]